MGSRRAETSTCLLYLYVDVVLALGDDLDVGIVDGLLVVLDARRPVRRRTQHLANTDMMRRFRYRSIIHAAGTHYCEHTGVGGGSSLPVHKKEATA